MPSLIDKFVPTNYCKPSKKDGQLISLQSSNYWVANSRYSLDELSNGLILSICIDDGCVFVIIENASFKRHFYLMKNNCLKSLENQSYKDDSSFIELLEYCNVEADYLANLLYEIYLDSIEK